MDKDLIKEIISSNARITVITGPNGSGKTTLINKIGKEHPEFLILDSDSHCRFNQKDLKDFIDDLKEKSKLMRIIIASLKQEIIDIADKAVIMQKKKISYA